MNPEMVPVFSVVSALAGASFGAYVMMKFMRKDLSLEKGRSNEAGKREAEARQRATEAIQQAAESDQRAAEANQRAIDADRRAADAGRETTEARAEARAKTSEAGDLRIQNAALQTTVHSQTLLMERDRAEIITLKERLGSTEGELQAANSRADNNGWELAVARRRTEQLIRDILTTQITLHATKDDLQKAESLLAELRPWYEMAEKAARYFRGEHASEQSMSASRLERINLLEAHILDLHAKLKVAESRAARNEVYARLIDLAKIILGGHMLPPIPGKL